MIQSVKSEMNIKREENNGSHSPALRTTAASSRESSQDSWDMDIKISPANSRSSSAMELGVADSYVDDSTTCNFATHIPNLKNQPIREKLEQSISSEAKQKVNNIVEEVGHLTDPEKLLLYLRLPTGSTSNDIPSKQNGNPSLCKSEHAQANIWVKSHLEEDPEISIPKKEVYTDYANYCHIHSLVTLSQADFGKVMKWVFPNMKPRRLGTRGNSQYCYSGLKKRFQALAPTLPSIQLTEEEIARFENVERDEELLSAAEVLVCEWAQKVLDRKFTGLQDLAFHLVSSMVVDSRSVASVLISSAYGSKNCGKDGQTGSLLSQGSLKKGDTKLQLQRKIQERGKIKEQRRIIEEQTKEHKRRILEQRNQIGRQISARNQVEKMMRNQQSSITQGKTSVSAANNSTSDNTSSTLTRQESSSKIVTKSSNISSNKLHSAIQMANNDNLSDNCHSENNANNTKAKMLNNATEKKQNIKTLMSEVKSLTQASTVSKTSLPLNIVPSNLNLPNQDLCSKSKYKLKQPKMGTPTLAIDAALNNTPEKISGDTQALNTVLKSHGNEVNSLQLNSDLAKSSMCLQQLLQNGQPSLKRPLPEKVITTTNIIKRHNSGNSKQIISSPSKSLNVTKIPAASLENNTLNDYFQGTKKNINGSELLQNLISSNKPNRNNPVILVQTNPPYQDNSHSVMEFPDQQSVYTHSFPQESLELSELDAYLEPKESLDSATPFTGQQRHVIPEDLESSDNCNQTSLLPHISLQSAEVNKCDLNFQFVPIHSKTFDTQPCAPNSPLQNYPSSGYNSLRNSPVGSSGGCLPDSFSSTPLSQSHENLYISEHTCSTAPSSPFVSPQGTPIPRSRHNSSQHSHLRSTPQSMPSSPLSAGQGRNLYSSFSRSRNNSGNSQLSPKSMPHSPVMTSNIDPGINPRNTFVFPELNSSIASRTHSNTVGSAPVSPYMTNNTEFECCSSNQNGSWLQNQNNRSLSRGFGVSETQNYSFLSQPITPSQQSTPVMQNLLTTVDRYLNSRHRNASEPMRRNHSALQSLLGIQNSSTYNLSSQESEFIMPLKQYQVRYQNQISQIPITPDVPVSPEVSSILHNFTYPDVQVQAQSSRSHSVPLIQGSTNEVSSDWSLPMNNLNAFVSANHQTQFMATNTSYGDSAHSSRCPSVLSEEELQHTLNDLKDCDNDFSQFSEAFEKSQNT